jgi:hypothetical protein
VASRQFPHRGSLRLAKTTILGLPPFLYLFVLKMSLFHGIVIRYIDDLFALPNN